MFYPDVLRVFSTASKINEFLNGILKISLEIISEKDALTEEKKNQHTWETIG